ncbi:phosphotransferase family protein [Candidatus Poriferisodalis sp.]|uniref:phosphotransferase family protein n=1 Tax=Candidatus Poriferisodalis sp. TaxID=3101277 RepID=UPI003B51C7F4
MSRPGSELASVGELLGSCHDCVARFAPGSGFSEGPQAVATGQVVCHGDIAPRNTVFGDGRATAFIDWDAIFVASPMWDLAHAVWQFAPVCDDADRWLGGSAGWDGSHRPGGSRSRSDRRWTTFPVERSRVLRNSTSPLTTWSTLFRLHLWTSSRASHRFSARRERPNSSRYGALRLIWA